MAMKYGQIRSLLNCAGALLLLWNCSPAPLHAESKAPPGRQLESAAGDTTSLTDSQYLMRKATIGSRAERLEALDVIERSNDPALLTFLLERLQKEDDRFLQIRVMHALASYGDARAVQPLRHLARWDTTRVGIEATMALYELGDDYLMPHLIQKLRPDEDNPELPGIVHRALRKMTGENLPPSVRTWMNYYYAHQFEAYQQRAWYWPFRAPLMQTVEGGTKLPPHPKGKAPLPKEDVRLRHTHVIWSDWWKNGEQ